MRSIHSILDRTDLRYMKEIILVDDYSDIDGLHENVKNAVDDLNSMLKKEEEMLETNKIEIDVMDYFNDDDEKSTEKTSKSKIGINIRLLRTSKREGLIRARLYGADNAVGEVNVEFFTISLHFALKNGSPVNVILLIHVLVSWQ